MMVQAIILAAAEEFGVSVLDIQSDRRGSNETVARHVAQYLALKLTTAGVTDVGQAIGKREPSSVTHAQKSVTGRMASEPAFAARVDRVREAAETAMAELRKRRIGSIDAIKPVALAEKIVRSGRLGAMGVSVQEIATMAACLVTFTRIIDNAADLILGLEEFGDLDLVDPTRPDRDELVGQLEALRNQIDRTGILSAVASQRRPANGEA